MKELKCPICGEPTKVRIGIARKDNLCAKHANMLKAKEISINEEGLFIDTKTKKVLNKDYIEKEQVNNQENNDISRCAVCGKETTKPGYYFCPSCFGTYNKKELWVQFKHCKPTGRISESYEGRYKCEDGHIVKSKSERAIDNYLFENGIPHAYEREYISKNDKSKVLCPDFTLVNYKNSGKDVFIEHWGYNDDNIEYTKLKKNKIDTYKNEKVTVISTYEKDIENYKVSLQIKLANFEFEKINFIDEKGVPNEKEN